MLIIILFQILQTVVIIFIMCKFTQSLSAASVCIKSTSSIEVECILEFCIKLTSSIEVEGILKSVTEFYVTE